MDKRAVAAAFRERLQALLGEERGGVAGFLRDTGIDRSALSQFLDPGIDRMPRAETLRRIAEARGVTADWLLSLSNVPEGQQEVTPSVRIESAQSPEGGSPVDQWRREAAGMKLRYVPSSLPDMLGLADDAPVPDPAPAGQPENILGGFRLGEMDVEIAMPVQTLEDLSQGAGLWRGVDPRLRRRQLAHMAATCAETYPTLRLHLYDGRHTFAAPFTVFGRFRAALYLGEAYLVVTSAEQVAALTRLFDNLVRRAVVGPERVQHMLYELADAAVILTRWLSKARRVEAHRIAGCRRLATRQEHAFAGRAGEAGRGGGDAADVGRLDHLDAALACEVEDEHEVAARRGDRRQPPVVADRDAAGVVARPPLHLRRRRQRLEAGRAGPVHGEERRMLELRSLPLQRHRQRPVAPGGDVAQRVQPQRLRQLEQLDDLAARRVEIGEVRAHRREVQLGPPRGRVGLDAAVRHREPPPVGHQPHLVRAGAAGRHLADPLVAVARVPDAEPAGPLGDGVLGGEEQAAVAA